MTVVLGPPGCDGSRLADAEVLAASPSPAMAVAPLGVTQAITAAQAASHSAAFIACVSTAVTAFLRRPRLPERPHGQLHRTPRERRPHLAASCLVQNAGLPSDDVRVRANARDGVTACGLVPAGFANLNILHDGECFVSVYSPADRPSSVDAAAPARARAADIRGAPTDLFPQVERPGARSLSRACSPTVDLSA
jgi:hypothetical protein